MTTRPPPARAVVAPVSARVGIADGCFPHGFANPHRVFHKRKRRGMAARPGAWTHRPEQSQTCRRDERATVVGHSMGSFIARKVAIRCPRRVTKLVLVGAVTSAAR